MATSRPSPSRPTRSYSTPPTLAESESDSSRGDGTIGDDGTVYSGSII